MNSNVVRAINNRLFPVRSTRAPMKGDDTAAEKFINYVEPEEKYGITKSRPACTPVNLNFS